MTEAEYRNHPAVSRSELWKLQQSPEKFAYAKNHPEEPTPALLFGQVFHKLALEPDSFEQEYAVAPKCDRRTKEGKLGVSQSQIERRLKKKIDNMNADDFTQFIGIFNAIKQGESKIADWFDSDPVASDLTNELNGEVL